MEKHRAVTLRVEDQGAPIIKHGVVIAESNNLVALSIELTSHWCEVSATGSDDDVPLIALEATSDSLYLQDGVATERDTIIAFPEYAGWFVWCAQISRYTLAVCLMKEEF